MPFARVAALAVLAGLGVGGLVAAATVADMRDGPDGRGGRGYAALAGNYDSVLADRQRLADACPDCRDSYAIAYPDDPGRARTSVRLALRGDAAGGSADRPFAPRWGGDWNGDWDGAREPAYVLNADARRPSYPASDRPAPSDAALDDLARTLQVHARSGAIREAQNAIAQALGDGTDYAGGVAGVTVTRGGAMPGID